MAKCHLIIDSCCDLPASVVRRPGVTLMKFPYTVDGGTFEDDLFESVSAEAFYGAMRKGAEPSTAQVTLQTLTDTFTAAAEEGTPAVYLAFSSGLSASFDAACVVRDQVLAEHPDFELHIVDTHLASVAEGLLVYEALVQHEKGMSAAELAAWAEEARCFVNEEFMVDELEALRRGRWSAWPGGARRASGSWRSTTRRTSTTPVRPMSPLWATPTVPKMLRV